MTCRAAAHPLSAAAPRLSVAAPRLSIVAHLQCAATDPSTITGQESREQLRRSNSWASGAMNTHSPPHGMSPKPPLPPIAHNQAAGEKHTPPPYDSVYNRLAGDDVDEELEEIMRARRLKRILKYSAYALILVLTILACALTGYFLTSRTPTVALHAVNSPENLGKKFKLQGTKLQFRIELTYRVQNDNYFDMFVDDISTAVFWPDTKFALGGGRLSNVKVPARRVVEITMPVTVRYDVKRGPPPILLGMVESCGLHDAGIGEMSLEVEVQSDYHTRMKQASIQTGRQAVSVKCPVRHMATLQIGDGASGNIGDIVRTMNA
ncbi:hypothetical protein GQ54DRAFT_319258 [Martensiomyces pterosporus]|nr:hypothetical protein GQ54DRAFT_319258 [Martensiomyces pterosporus]